MRIVAEEVLSLVTQHVATRVMDARRRLTSNVGEPGLPSSRSSAEWPAMRLQSRPGGFRTAANRAKAGRYPQSQVDAENGRKGQAACILRAKRDLVAFTPIHAPSENANNFRAEDGGRDRDRTCDPFHVKEVLFR